MKILVVIPTYNERGTLEQVIEKIFSLKIEGLSVMVVDDASPDGTGDRAEELAKIFPITVLHRLKKEGLGRAYSDAFARIVSLSVDKAPELIFEMDADLSHDPLDLPRFLEAAKNTDLVLGSRYVSGGSIEHWNFFRRVISRLGNFYARTLLRLPYSDITGGFKLYKREVIENIDVRSLDSSGYNFQIETTYRAYKKGFKIKEIPIVFSERTVGKSKFSPSIVIESFFKVALLPFKTFS
jgi:dolichol-phosphate mannosyltransferase